jgi:hypothetical protein
MQQQKNMNSKGNPKVAIVMPVGPGKELTLDTLDSVNIFCPEPHMVFLVDDHTQDGTQEALSKAKKPHWEIIRNARSHGADHLVHTLCSGFERAALHPECELVLKLDQDALLIKPGVMSEAISYAEKNPKVGIFGVYEVDHDRPRNFTYYRRVIDREAGPFPALIGRRPSWIRYLKMAEQNGYQRGSNVFGGAYFITRKCLLALHSMGALNVPWGWHSIIGEDIYFSMVAVAAGFQMGHFAAPDGPLCLDWQGMPMSAAAFASSKYKLVHSVDKGKNTGRGENEGKTAREVFRELRAKVAARIESTVPAI